MNLQARVSRCLESRLGKLTRGVTAVEYGLLVFLISAVMVPALVMLGPGIGATFQKAVDAVGAPAASSSASPAGDLVASPLLSAWVPPSVAVSDGLDVRPLLQGAAAAPVVSGLDVIPWQSVAPSLGFGYNSGWHSEGYALAAPVVTADAVTFTPSYWGWDPSQPEAAWVGWYQVNAITNSGSVVCTDGRVWSGIIWYEAFADGTLQVPLNQSLTNFGAPCTGAGVSVLYMAPFVGTSLDWTTGVQVVYRAGDGFRLVLAAPALTISRACGDRSVINTQLDAGAVIDVSDPCPGGTASVSLTAGGAVLGTTTVQPGYVGNHCLDGVGICGLEATSGTQRCVTGGPSGSCDWLAVGAEPETCSWMSGPEIVASLQPSDCTAAKSLNLFPLPISHG